MWLLWASSCFYAQGLLYRHMQNIVPPPSPGEVTGLELGSHFVHCKGLALSHLFRLFIVFSLHFTTWSVLRRVFAICVTFIT